MPPNCRGSPPPQGEGRAGATAPERGKDSAGPSVYRNSGPSPSLRDTSPRRGERQEKEPLLVPLRGREAGCLAANLRDNLRSDLGIAPYALSFGTKLITKSPRA